MKGDETDKYIFRLARGFFVGEVCVQFRVSKKKGR